MTSGAQSALDDLSHSYWLSKSSQISRTLSMGRHRKKNTLQILSFGTQKPIENVANGVVYRCYWFSEPSFQNWQRVFFLRCLIFDDGPFFQTLPSLTGYNSLYEAPQTNELGAVHE